MKDPYEVLGVSRNATEEQIKAAYRDKARRFHPDNFVNNADAAEMANEKMQEINQAYDSIINKHKGHNKNSNDNFNNASSEFSDVRNMISQGRLEDAQAILDGVPPNNRSAEWYFLNGTVLYRRGWFDAAFTSLSTAIRMDPQNPEYREALNRMQQSRRGYGQYRGNTPNYTNANGCNSCDMCSTLICADCCCECMGADLISCC